MKRGNKKGQFYLLAAIIIIFIIIGIFTLRNYTKVRPKQTRIYDLGEELGIETGNVIDYGIYNKNSTQPLIEHWAETYYNYTKEKNVIENWVFVYGNESDMVALTFTTENVGGVGIVTESGNIVVPVEMETKGRKVFEPSASGDVAITFKNFTHQFKLKEGENFFFVLRGGEYVTES